MSRLARRRARHAEGTRTAAARRRLPGTRLVVGVLALAVVLGGGLALFEDRSATIITATFPTATGLYPGDDVRVLGVPVGEVTDVEPRGASVVVTLSVGSGTKIPTDAKAAIVAPSLVSGRFVQLAPVWRSGPSMDDGSSIPVERTAVPVSFDEVKQQLTDLSTALGPQGSTDPGALAQAITTIDANLANGNAEELRAAISGLRTTATALADKRSDLYATISNLDSFTRNLAVNDAAVVSFNTRLASASTVLADNRKELNDTIDRLAELMTSLESFLAANGKGLASVTARAATVNETLANQADDLAKILHIAPQAVTNLYNSIEDNAITGRTNLNNLDSVGTLVCGALLSVGGAADTCATALQPLLSALGLTTLPGSIASKDQVPATSSAPTPSAPPAPAASPSPSPAAPTLDLVSLLGLGKASR